MTIVQYVFPEKNTCFSWGPNDHNRVASRGRLLFMPPDRRLEWTKTTQALTARGALQKTPESIVVTLKGRYWARWASRSLERDLDLRT